MDCAPFFTAVDERLADRCEGLTRTTAGDQCVVDFFHPRIVEALGTDGVATQFNRSGVVWASNGGFLAAELRVPADHAEAVTAALADAPLSFDRSDHRGVSAPDGETVTVLHYSVRTSGVAVADRDATLTALAAALSV